MSEISFSKTIRGKELLILRNKYTYTLSKTNNASTLWRCTNRSDCSATITLDDVRSKISHENHQHACEPDLAKIEVRKLINCAKEKARFSLRSIQEIYEDKIQETVNKRNIQENLSFLSVKSTLYRARKMQHGTEKLLYNTMEDVKVPEGLAENFHIIEDGECDKMLIFCSFIAENVIKMEKVCSYYSDGTFRSAPKPFTSYL